MVDCISLTLADTARLLLVKSAPLLRNEFSTGSCTSVNERAGWVLNHITYLLNVLLHNYLGKRDESACFTKTDATKQSYSLPIIVWAGALINSGFQTIDYYFPTGLKDIPWRLLKESFLLLLSTNCGKSC
ncbi:hypothetical protein Tco_0217817 [Tanacetum coccineum]